MHQVSRYRNSVNSDSAAARVMQKVVLCLCLPVCSPSHLGLIPDSQQFPSVMPSSALQTQPLPSGAGGTCQPRGTCQLLGSLRKGVTWGACECPSGKVQLPTTQTCVELLCLQQFF